MTTPTLTEFMAAEDRRAALSYVIEAFTEAMLAGVDPSNLAHAALDAALQELVGAWGEEATARFVSELPARIRNGEFSFGSVH
ncbi:MAG: hypothetical protein ACO27F_07080 [Beijerinckiaceae bacterium]|jgi:hypothetical protein